MKPSTMMLTVFWVCYVVAAIWVLVVETSPVQRDLLLIVGGFTILAVIATAALLSDRSDGTDSE